MELWYTEKHTPNLGLSLKIKRGLLHQKTPYQQLDILESFEYGRVLLLDGLIMLTERDEFVYHEMISHVPMVSHPNPGRILVIGGGDGGTVRELLKHPGIEGIDLVEIDRAVIDSCIEYFPGVSHGLKHPKVNVSVEDGIQFVRDKKGIYDLVIVDSTDPIGPAVGLFETGFYKDIYSALKEKGVIVTQSGSPFQDPRVSVMAYKNLSSIFHKVFSYIAFIPTYPSGLWSFTYASKGPHPLEDMRADHAAQIGHSCRYYNPQIHRGAFCLPNFFKSELARSG